MNNELTELKNRVDSLERQIKEMQSEGLRKLPFKRSNQFEELFGSNQFETREVRAFFKGEEMFDRKDKTDFFQTRTSPSIEFKDLTPIFLGNSALMAYTKNQDLASEENYAFWIAGKDKEGTLGETTLNTIVYLDNQPATLGSTNQSFLYAIRPPLWTKEGGISITSGGTTMTDATRNWTADELIGAHVNVFDTDGTYKEAREITDNDATSITVGTAWTYTDADSSYTIYVPVYLGQAQVPWRRLYIAEGTGGGIRIGDGATAGGQNGLLYMDATGDLYWRNKAGTSTKLN